jgi:hypothetical protein
VSGLACAADELGLFVLHSFTQRSESLFVTRLDVGRAQNRPCQDSEARMSGEIPSAKP